MASVSLSKNQSVSLTKQAGIPLTRLQFGLGWDPAKPKKSGFLGSIFGGGGAADSIDLDASVVVFDKNANVIDTVWFRKQKSSCGSISHSGDNLTGEGDGDDETIFVDLTRLPANAEHLCFTVNSFRGQTFNEVEGASCRVVDQAGKELVKFELAEKGSHSGIAIATLRKNNNDWQFKALGLICRGRTIEDMIPQIVAQII